MYVRRRDLERDTNIDSYEHSCVCCLSQMFGVISAAHRDFLYVLNVGLFPDLKEKRDMTHVTPSLTGWAHSYVTWGNREESGLNDKWWDKYLLKEPRIRT